MGEQVKILSVNTGSSSIKCALYEMPQERLLMKGEIERIGQCESVLTIEAGENKRSEKRGVAGFHEGVELLLNSIYGGEIPVLKSLDEIDAVGHRVVHGGQSFEKALFVNDETMGLIKKYAEFAPLHRDANITAIESCKQLLTKCSNVAVFDTALYKNLPPKAFLYGLPIEMYEKNGIRRYGFHGLNHGYVAIEAARLIGKPLKDLKVISCHLGSGSSITAFKSGDAIDTSMGFTPFEGLLMGTRCGDIDPGIVIYLVRHLHYDAQKLEEILDKDSGLKGLCGKNDMRDIAALAESGDQNAQNALDTFVYRIQKYIGAYTASLGGLDVVIFTGGIGENSPALRKKILDSFGYLNIKIDENKNRSNSPLFSHRDSCVYALTIPANEELAITRETFEITSDEKP